MSPHRIRFVVAGACLLGLLAWLLHGPARRTLHGEPAAASAPQRVAPSTPLPASSPRVAPSRAATPAISAAMSASGLHSASHCGADEAPRPESATGDVRARAGSPRFLAANARIDAALRASTDPFLPAVAVWLDIPGTATPAQRVDQLVKLAQASADPRVYALAYGVCADDKSAPVACRLLSARQWAQIDQENATAWLAVFVEARASNDLAGQDEALRAAAASMRYESRLFAPAAAVGGLFDDDDDMAAATSLAATNAFAKATSWHLGPTALFEACRDRAAGDAARAALCVQVADVMMAHSMDLLSQAIGSGLDFATTGDPARRDRVRADRVALSAAMASDAQAVSGLSDCGQLHALARGLRRAAEIGEASAIRERHAAAASAAR